jgi:iron complex outermembrane receptor protein
MTYAQYARGYRAGGVFFFAPPGFQTFKPEKLDAFEIGVKSSFHGPVSGYFNAAIFYNKFSDQQLQLSAISPTLPAAAAIINAGKSRIFGVEIDSAIKPTDRLTFNIGYSYLYSEVQQIIIPPQQPGTDYMIIGTTTPGSPLPNTPKHKIVVSANYDLPVDPTVGKVSVGATYSHTTKQLVGSTPDFPDIPAYGVLNFNASWKEIYGRPVDVDFFMTNALGKVYATWVQDFNESLGWAGRNLGEPRMFGGRVRYHF